ncbi:hypothetical protein BUZ06_02415 [Staphylococcus gallinarum]|nr:hypothetical protein [Staphylococcus gallinarum]PTK90990.1 hypothetical protein BUZ13_09735 [Staphylococcus gallinarum]PTK93523.1 hypothetical protein BUZ05_07095 [Staphylococcus gallinarum]RIO90435.1 hypothetical protein BUZ06_02415 [Staphylococcus gallinarum]
MYPTLFTGYLIDIKFILLARIPRGQLLLVVFSLSCSLRSLTNNTSYQYLNAYLKHFESNCL